MTLVLHVCIARGLYKLAYMLYQGDSCQPSLKVSHAPPAFPLWCGRSFVQRSLEEDLSHVVGLSFEFWVLIVLIVLMSGPFGFPTAIFMGGAGLVMMITNGKLAMIIRSVTERECLCTVGATNCPSNISSSRPYTLHLPPTPPRVGRALKHAATAAHVS